MTKKEQLCQQELQALIEKLNQEYYGLTAQVIQSVMSNEFDNARQQLSELEEHVSDPHDSPRE